MPRAAQLRDKVTFQRQDTTGDAYGNPSSGTWADLFSIRGRLMETRGYERIEAGAIAAPMTAELFVRSSSLSRTLTEADRAVIGGVAWNVRSIANPDRRNRWLAMTLERGVAT